MKANKLIFFLLFISQTSWSQIEKLSLRAMLNLRTPSTEKTYNVDAAQWRYDAADDSSKANVGTIIKSNKEFVKGCFKRIFNTNDGVDIDWFITSNNVVINQALESALKVSEKINFGPKTYRIEPLTIKNRQKIVFIFNKTTLQTENSTSEITVLRLEKIPQLSLLGDLTIDGNASKVKITNPLQHNGKAFLQIVAPANNPASKLTIGQITIINMPMCGINIDTQNQFFDMGYDRILVKCLREINGFNHLNIQKEDFSVWGVNVRGAHRVVLIDSLYAEQDQEPWGDAAIEKPFYTFTFENQVDATIHKRKDSLYVKNIHARYPCSIVFYTQAINHVLVDNYLIENVLRKPNIDDTKAYPTMLRSNLSWIGSKHTWTSFRSPNSSFRIKNFTIRGTNSAFMNESSSNDITGLWLNKGMNNAVFDKIETDIRIKLYGDGDYSSFADVPDGGHWVKKFISHIPQKRNYAQSLSADLTIDSLILAKNTGTTFAMGNAKIGAIVQEPQTQATFESRDNKFINSSLRHNGFVVGSCQATNIVWRFNWNVSTQRLDDTTNIKTAERYEFKNFSGNNFLQTHTTLNAKNGSSKYLTAYSYDADATARDYVQKHLDYVEFDWENVTMKLADASTNNLTRRYFLSQNTQNQSLTTKGRKIGQKGWKNRWQPNSFKKCKIE